MATLTEDILGGGTGTSVLQSYCDHVHHLVPAECPQEFSQKDIGKSSKPIRPKALRQKSKRLLG